MATAAQIAANQSNAQASTGPRTAEGKARSASNAVSFGLFSNRGLVHPEETEEHNQLRAGLAEELKPDTILEHAFAAQILHAMWRLRRCALVEETLAERTGGIDPMDNPETLPTQTAIDRARAQSNVALRRSMAELRRLQTERYLRAELANAEGLVSHKEVARAKLLSRRVDGLHRFETILRQADEQVAAIVSHGNANRGNTNLTQSAAAAQFDPSFITVNPSPSVFPSVENRLFQ
jgi:hypothetical protein